MDIKEFNEKLDTMLVELARDQGVVIERIDIQYLFIRAVDKGCKVLAGVTDMDFKVTKISD